MDYDYSNPAEPTLKPITFGSIALHAVLSSNTETDEEALALFALAEKLQANLDTSTPTELQLNDKEFEVVSNAMRPQAVVVKSRFLQMVAKLNKAK